MKIYRLLTLAVVAALSASFTSCDDDDDNGKKFDTTLLPSVITEVEVVDGSNITRSGYQFAYSADQRLTGWEEANGTATTKYSISYGTNNKITSVKKERGAYTEYTYFTYDGDKITVSETAEPEDGDVVLTVNNNGYLLSSQYEYLVAPEEEEEEGGGETSTKVIERTEYSYSGNNLTKITEKYNNIILGTKTASFDAKAGIFRNVNVPQWFLLSVVEGTGFNLSNWNNVTKIEGTEYSLNSNTEAILESTTVSTYQYPEYELDFPTKATNQWVYTDKHKVVKTENYSYTITYKTVK